jgi:tetratricopeptide (TPR) repeat protein
MVSTFGRRLTTVHIENVFQIQEEIAAAVVNGLKISLLGGIPESQETDPEVYSLYLQGKYLNTITADKEELEEAVSAFKQALAIDPDYAPAWLGLSWAYESQAGGTLTHEQSAAMSREAADRALAIDDNMALAWSTLSFLKKKYEWDWQGAEAAADKALQLEPNNVDVLLGVSSVAQSLGHLDKSINLLERAVTLDPLRLNALMNLGYRYMLDGRYDAVLEKYRQVLVLNPEFSWAYQSIAENDSAFEMLEAAFEQRDSRLSHFLQPNSFDRLKADPRYPVFLEKLGLLEYWKAIPPE